jgi:hypothetical protein
VVDIDQVVAVVDIDQDEYLPVDIDQVESGLILVELVVVDLVPKVRVHLQLLVL